MTTITVNRIQIKRSSSPGTLPASLADGEEFVNTADGFRIFGDGVTPPEQLPRIPFVPAINWPLSDPIKAAIKVEATRAIAAEQANATAIQANATAVAAETSRAQSVEALKAPLASPAFTGTPTVPTAVAGTSTTQIASTAFVATAVAAGGGGSGSVPTSRQVLTSGLATGGGDLTADRTITVPKAAQSDVATGTDDAKALTSLSVAARFASLAPLASPALVGTPTAPTAAAGTNTTQIATTAFVTGALGSYLTSSAAAATYAPLSSPALTGTPTAPTPAAGDNSTKLATTAFVATAIGATNQSLANSGYKKLPGGLILQWLRVSFSAASDANLTWPIAFPTAVFSLSSGLLTDGDAAQTTLYGLKLDNLTTSGVIARVRQVSNGGAVIAATGVTVMITAIGN